ncbi:hypothetical protein HHI36_016622 [Cryptolaemus montrouzieri]|uniref:Uncharacterized protein n=1 Tax=Cryptolaemus montrouzieri TaxID=559131 RepID=A0ABD2NKA8_9CUCU
MTQPTSATGYLSESEMPEAECSSVLENAKQKKFSSGSLGPADIARPKVVTVKHPESNKLKPTAKKNKRIQADLDVSKEFLKCKEQGLKRLDLSKSNITQLPSTLRDLTHLASYIYMEINLFHYPMK